MLYPTHIRLRAGLLLLLPLLGCGRPAAPVVAPGAARAMVPGEFDQTIELRRKDGGAAEIVVTNLPAHVASKLRQFCEPGTQPWTDYLLVTTAPGRTKEADVERTPMLGNYRVAERELYFTPRFPLAKGVTIEAYFNQDGNLKQVMKDSRLGGWAYNLVTQTFSVEKPLTLEDTRVAAVYPTANTLPENLLKFYIQFSAPMSRGQAYDCVHLFETGGKEVDMPFLELSEELWDPRGRRLTLFIDPGRIKRELKPRQEMGPVLVEGKSFTLVIDAKWRDAEGNPLKAAFRKTFKAGPSDEQMPDAKQWTIQTPTAGTKEPVIVAFPESLDFGLLERVLSITGAKGETIAGKVEIADLERRWAFTPEQAWPAGAYYLIAQAILEDLAGNNLARPFEVDLLKPIDREVKADTIKLQFEIK